MQCRTTGCQAEEDSDGMCLQHWLLAESALITGWLIDEGEPDETNVPLDVHHFMCAQDARPVTVHFDQTPPTAVPGQGLPELSECQAQAMREEWQAYWRTKACAFFWMCCRRIAQGG